MQKMFFLSDPKDQMLVGNTSFPTTAKWDLWDQFTEHDYNIRLNDLKGATVLFVTSQKGIYIACYMENPCFRTIPISKPYDQFLLFRKNVIEAMDAPHSPIPAEFVPALMPLVMKSEQLKSEDMRNEAGILFTDYNGVKAALISPQRIPTPQRNTTGKYLYPNYLDSMKQHLEEILPSDASIVEKPYVPLSEYNFWLKNKPPTEAQAWIITHAIDKVYFQYSYDTNTQDQGYELYVGDDAQPVISDYWTSSRPVVQLAQLRASSEFPPIGDPAVDSNPLNDSELLVGSSDESTLGSLQHWNDQQVNEPLVDETDSPASGSSSSSSRRNVRVRFFGLLKKLRLGTISSHPQSQVNTPPTYIRRPSTSHKNDTEPLLKSEQSH